MKKFVCSQEKLTNRILLQLLLYFAFSVLCSHSTDEHDVSAINTNEKNGENCGVQDDRIGMIFKQNKKDFSLYSYRSPSFPDTSNGHITSSFGSNEIKNVIDFRKDSLKSQNNQYPFLHTSLNEILSKIMQKSLGKNSETSPHSSDLSIDRSSSNRVAIETRSKKCLKRIHNKNSRPKSDISFSNKYDFFFDDDDYSVNHKNEVLRHFNIRPDKCDTIGKTDNDASRVVIDDDVCILLDVYQNTGDLSNSECGLQQSTKYELLEPVELELGMTDRHAVDFAYMPVMSSDVYPTSYFSDDDMNPDDNITIETDNSTTQDYEDTSLVEEVSPNVDQWWQWWIPSRWWKNKIKKDSFSSNYRLNNDAFAGGSHGEVWRGRRKCNIYEQQKQSDSCNEQLIFKRLRVEAGYHTLEAGLREVYFGSLLQGTSIATTIGARSLFTNYVEHFFGQGGELWIVFKDAGPSLRSYMYTAKKADDFVIFQHSWFWTLLRMSVAKKHRVKSNKTGSEVVAVLNASVNSTSTNSKSHQQEKEQMDIASVVGRELMRSVLRQILESASFLHENDIIHRDIKPSNIMCRTNFDPDHLESLNIQSPEVACVLGDFSSAYDDFTKRNLYVKGPSRLEQTDEYAPPEAIFGNAYNQTSSSLSPAFDSWSIGIVALELLLGSPNVFSVDQRTRVVLAHKMKKKGATPEEIEKAMYLAALSQFCIYNPQKEKSIDWPLRDGDPLHKSAMTKHSCTLTDFHRALRARDPLGWGFNDSDTLLQLLWQLLAWNPQERITASEALKHPYFTTLDITLMPRSADNDAIESQMLHPEIDFNVSNSVSEFRCPKCGRIFSDWQSCFTHANARKHAKFCTYDKTSLPTCLHAHSMLPAHSNSGYCDIQGRRPSIEDFHAVHLLHARQFYGIFDGHLGNLASKYAASFLHKELASRLDESRLGDVDDINWKEKVEVAVSASFSTVHKNFLDALELSPFGFMDNSGTTATTAIVSNTSVIIASLGDSRAVISSRRPDKVGIIELSAIQLTKDHQASDPAERLMVESRGGKVVKVNSVDRVNGVLVITRSIGDSNLAHLLSRQPQVIAMTRHEINSICGSSYVDVEKHPCFLIVASDGLWDTMSNQEAVDMVAEVIFEETTKSTIGGSWRETAGFQKAAEALTIESYVRGSMDNIGVCIVALD